MGDEKARLPEVPLADASSIDYDYHGDFTRQSATMIKAYIDSTREYEALYVTRKKKPKPANAAMDLGTVCHSVFLEEKELDEITAEYPSFALNKNGGLIGVHSAMVKDVIDRYREGEKISDMIIKYPPRCITASGNLSKQAESFRKDNPKKYAMLPADFDEMVELLTRSKTPVEHVLKSDVLETVKIIVDKIRDHECYQWISHPNCLREHDLFWRHPATNLACRCRPDFLIPLDTFALFFDLKITINWKPDDFSTYLCGNRRGGQRGWVQQCHYSNGIETFYKTPAVLRFICVNPEFPHQIVVNRVAQATIDECKVKYEETMAQLCESIRTRNFAEKFEDADNVVTMDNWEIT